MLMLADALFITGGGILFFLQLRLFWNSYAKMVRSYRRMMWQR